MIELANEWPHFLYAAVIGYLLGSIPFGVIITRIAGLGDIRSIGSGNIGTTNVLRTGKKSLAALTLLGDALKGTVAVLLVSTLFGPDIALVAGLFAFLGHLYPVWLKFRGGKGVATFLGILLGLFLPVAVAFAAIWIACAYLTRYSSLSALLASLATPLLLLAMSQWQMAGLFAILTVILWLKHYQNIARLLSGSESKIGAKG